MTPGRGIKCISVRQPWASLFCYGLKSRLPDGAQVETRHWMVHHRGTLAIHAAKKWGAEQKAAWARIRTLAVRLGHAKLADLPATLPLGCVVAVGELTCCRPTWGPYGASAWTEGLDELGLATGDFTPGRYGWFLRSIRPVDPPVPAKGFQGLFGLTPDVTALVRERAGLMEVAR